MLQPTTFVLHPDKGGANKEGKTTGSEGSCSCSPKITWANECEIKEVDRSNAGPFKRPHLQSDAVKIYIFGVNVIWGFSWVTPALVWSANIGISRCSDTERRDVSSPEGLQATAHLQICRIRLPGAAAAHETRVEADGCPACSMFQTSAWALWFVVLTGFHRKAVHFHLTRRYLDLFILFVYFCTSLHRNSSTDKQRWRQGTRSFSNPPPHAKMMGSKSCFILKNRQKNPRLLKCFLTALLPNLQGQQWTSSAPDCSSATVWWVSMRFCTDIFIVPRLKREGEIAWTVKNLWLLTWLPTTEQIHQSLSLHF